MPATLPRCLTVGRSFAHRRFAQDCEGALRGLLSVVLTPAVIGGVVGIAYSGSDQAVEVEGPQSERGLADERPLGQPQGGAFVGEADGALGEGHVEGVQEADRAQDVAFGGGQVGQGADAQGGEVVVEVAGPRGASGAAQFQGPGDG
ncbi:hypothetical protein ABTZ93_41550 [Streptomyces sp. NPDC097941]|uniref:hypothetical protein n=1 Tax=Streptomyces sp. NPDC097941 TaxID=3155685 RepID=UPI003328B18B